LEIIFGQNQILGECYQICQVMPSVKNCLLAKVIKAVLNS
jgi:hypothetical protein